jgi:hypothetical protein
MTTIAKKDSTGTFTAVEEVCLWLEAALKCQAWNLDPAEREAAEFALRRARAEEGGSIASVGELTPIASLTRKGKADVDAVIVTLEAIWRGRYCVEFVGRLSDTAMADAALATLKRIGHATDPRSLRDLAALVFPGSIDQNSRLMYAKHALARIWGGRYWMGLAEQLTDTELAALAEEGLRSLGAWPEGRVPPEEAFAIPPH